MVKTRTSSERGKHPADEPGDVVAPAAAQPPPAAAEATATGSTNNVEKCVNCQYYDRRRARPTDGKAPMWGQCRKHSPHLNPVTAKAYVVEGVWPLVRDDDWCGEWRILTRMPEEPVPESVALAAEDAPPAAPARARPGAAAAAEASLATSND